MHKTSIIAAAIVGASALVADLIFSAKTFFRHKKMLIKLCDENAELLTANTHLKAQLATYQQREKMLREGSFKREQELDATKDKLKSAHDHISVLRAEIVKLNRQLNQRKRRG